MTVFSEQKFNWLSSRSYSLKRNDSANDLHDNSVDTQVT